MDWTNKQSCKVSLFSDENWLSHLVRALHPRVCRGWLKAISVELQIKLTNQLRFGFEVLKGGSCLLFKKALSFLPEMLNLASTNNYDFCLGYFSGCGNWNCQIDEGRTLVWLTWPTRGMLQVGNGSQHINHRAKDAFIGLETRDLNQVLKTACVRLCTLSVTVHSCGWDNIVFSKALGTPPWPEWIALNDGGPLSHGADLHCIHGRVCLQDCLLADMGPAW